MRRWVALAIVLVAVALVILGGYRARADIGQALTARREWTETLAAWPVLREWASLREVRAGVRATSGGAVNEAGAGEPPAGVPGLPDGVPSFVAWRALPDAERWGLYTRPDWRNVRLATRAGGGTLAAALALVLGRTLAWPLLRGLWFVGALAIMGRRARPTASHGSARLATRREIGRLRPRPGEAHFVAGTSGRGPRQQIVSIPEAEHYEHLLLDAPNGAGKTSGFIIPNLLGETGGRTIIVADPKRELLKTTAPHLRTIYPPGRVWVLDFYDPTLSQGYNPLAWVRDMRTADLFARTWVKNTGTSGSEPFWDNAATTLIAAGALHLVRVAERDGAPPPPLAALQDLLCNRGFAAVRETLLGSPVPEVRAKAAGFLAYVGQSEKLLGGLFSELAVRFAVLDSPEVRATTGASEIDLAALGREPTALYIGFDLHLAAALAPLTACFFTQLFTALVEAAQARPDGALVVPVMCYLDEFGNLGHIPGFERWIATVRSARVGCLLVVQDTAQLVATYGESGAAIILTNAMTKICLAKVSRADAEYFSKLTGESTVLAASRSASRALLLPWADRGNRGAGEVARPVLTPAELRTLGDGALVVSQDRQPLVLRQRPWFRVPALAHLVPDLAGAGDALAACRRPMALPDPRAAEGPIVVEDAAIVAGAGDGPFAAPVEPPVGVADTNEPTASARPVERARPARAKRPRTAVRSAAVPSATEAAPMTLPIPIARVPALTPREAQLLMALAADPAASSAALGGGLGIAAGTVRKALGALRAKLGTGKDADGAALVALARERGLLTGEAAVGGGEPR
jgi:type IV secretion system protein VirD4